MSDRHIFQDEWLIPLIKGTEAFDEEEVRRWREEERSFLAQAIVDGGRLPFDRLTELVKERYRILSFDPDRDAVDQEAMSLVPESLCRKYALMPIEAGSKDVRLAMANPLDLEARKQVSWASGREIDPRYALPLNIDRLIARTLQSDVTVFNTLDRIEPDEIVEVIQGAARDEDTEEVKAPVIRLVNALLVKAMAMGASDIHIEHTDRSTEVRFRIDGLLRKIMVLPKYIGAGPVIARLKIMSDLDVAEHFKPQDGQVRIRIQDREIGLRLSILPAQQGEKAVIRLLGGSQGGVALNRLGLRPETLERLDRIIKHKDGIVLVTGPTGSGKSTTLHAAITRIQSPEINIVTVEDPVEYQIPGATQVQVDQKKGLTFASTLRSVLRQDPDIVLVGEIRDRETAEIAVQASLTGHLVFSTLHTIDTPTAVIRLQDMGIEPFKISASLRGVIGQRLVRRLCPQCAAVVSAQEMDETTRHHFQQRGYEERCLKAGGCEACGFTGYRGRLAIMEVLDVTDILAQAVADGAKTEDVRRLARTHGLLYSMEEDALWHLANGDTSLEEIVEHFDWERLTDPQPRAPESGDTGATPPLEERPRRVLVLDNEPDLLQVLDGNEIEEDVLIERAETAEAGLRQIAAEPPDILVLGFGFPRGTGLKVLRAVRGPLGLATLPVIGIVDENTTLRDIQSAGADDFLVRPVDPESIRKRLTAALFRLEAWSETSEIARPRTPANETERLRALRATGLLDSGTEKRFDHIAQMAQRIFSVPISTLSLIDEDRQYFKSHPGIDDSETPRAIAFCAHAIHSDEIMVVPDALLDARFSGNPMVQGPPHIRFYAGCPIQSPDGYNIGVFCIIDRKPRQIDEEGLQTLRDLSRMVELELAGSA